MILLDTNVLVDFFERDAANHRCAVQQIEDAVTGAGGAVSVVVVAELCAGTADPKAVPDELRKLGLLLFDLPAAAAPVCGQAYRRYRVERTRSGGGRAPTMPLPDFFIGAHAEVLGWKLSTRDPSRYEKYFPSVVLLQP